MVITAPQDYTAMFHRQITLALNTILTSVQHDSEQGDSDPAGNDAADIRADTADDTAGRSMEILQYALKLPVAWPLSQKLLRLLSPLIERDGRWREWLAYLQAGCALAQDFGDQEAYAELCLWSGVFYRTLGDYAAARRWLNISADIFQKMGDNYRYASALNRLAWTERLDQNVDQALTYANRALTNLAPNRPDPFLERARSFSILGAIAHDQGELREAEHYFRSVLQVPMLSREKPRLAWGYADLGLALSAQGKHEEALLHYRSALDILESLHSPVQAAVIKLNLAGIYLAMKNAVDALALCLQAREVLERVHDMRRMIMVETNMGIAYRLLAQSEKSQQVLYRVTQRAEKLGYPHLLINGLTELGLTHMTNSNALEAIVTFQSAIAHLKELDDSPRKETFRTELQLHLHQAQVAATQGAATEVEAREA